MSMNEEVRKAVESMDLRFTSGNSIAIERASMRDHEWQTIRTELTRLTEIADSVDPLVVRLGEVTTRLEKMRAIVAACATEVGAVVSPTCSEQFLADVPLEVRAVRRNAESRLEAANALLRGCVENREGLAYERQILSHIQAHLSEPRT